MYPQAGWKPDISVALISWCSYVAFQLNTYAFVTGAFSANHVSLPVVYVMNFCSDHLTE